MCTTLHVLLLPCHFPFSFPFHMNCKEPFPLSTSLYNNTLRPLFLHLIDISRYCYPFPWRHVNKAWPLIVLRVYTLSYANDFVKTYVGLISLEDGIIAKLDWFIEYCLDDSIAGWTRHWCNPKSWYFCLGKSECKVWGPCFGICDDWVWKIYLVIQGFKFSKYFHCEQKMFGAVQG